MVVPFQVFRRLYLCNVEFGLRYCRVVLNRWTPFRHLEQRLVGLYSLTAFCFCDFLLRQFPRRNSLGQRDCVRGRLHGLLGLLLCSWYGARGDVRTCGEKSTS